MDLQLKEIAERAAETAVERLLERIRTKPVIHQEYLSGQDAAVYIGVHETSLGRWTSEGVGPPSVLWANNCRRYCRADIDAWAAAGGPRKARES